MTSRLRAGLTFTASLAAASADARIRFRLEDAGRILDALTAIPDRSGSSPTYVAPAG